jgi:hypothetical protein
MWPWDNLMKYVYYDPNNMQIMAEFETANLSHQPSWIAKGYQRGIVPDGIVATRNHKVKRITSNGVIEASSVSRNPEQPTESPPTRLDILHDLLSTDQITSTQIKEMLQLERQGPIPSGDRG